MATHPYKALVKEQCHRSAPPKIAYLLNVFPSLSETFILQEILELEHLGLPLRIFSLVEDSNGKAAEAMQNFQATITYISHFSVWALMMVAIQRILKNPWRFLCTCIVMVVHYHRWSVLKHLLFAAYLANELEQEGIIHLHAHFATESTTIAQALHLFTGITYSFTAHAYDIYLSPKSELSYKMSMASFVSTCSAYNQRYLATLIDESLRERIHCIYVGLNPSDLPSNISIDSTLSGPPLILAVGRLIEKKGISYLVRSCKVLKDQGYSFNCRIVGEGQLRPLLEEEIRELELTDTVKLWGAEKNERVIEMYRQATIVALPCVISKDGDRDGLPRVLAEALYMGIPVVTTAVSGIPELITSGINGLLVPPNDSVALANALACLLDDPSLRSRLSISGRQSVVEQFDLTRNVGLLLKLLRKNVE